jgi:DNA-damage-inducible protein J
MAVTKVAGKKKASGGSAMSGVIRARVDPTLKAKAEAILESVGLNASDAIRLFYSQVALRRGLPFEVKVPNAATRKAMRDADAGKGTAYASAEEMFEKMDT